MPEAKIFGAAQYFKYLFTSDIFMQQVSKVLWAIFLAHGHGD